MKYKAVFLILLRVLPLKLFAKCPLYIPITTLLCVCSVVSDSLRPHGLSPPGSSIHGDSPGKNSGRVAMPSSRGSAQPRDGTRVSSIAGGFFTVWTTKETFCSSSQFFSSQSQYPLKTFLPNFTLHHSHSTLPNYFQKYNTDMNTFLLKNFQ